jgi:hypothetical protein
MTDGGKAEAAAKKRTAIALVNLTMTFTTNKFKTMNWPTNGLAWKIADALKKKYQPQDTMT